MKTIYLFLIICITGFYTSGQSIIDTTKLWSIVDDYNVFMSGYTEDPSNSYYIKFSGDTIINSITYAKILKSTDSSQTNWTTIGYAREDTTGKIYFRNLSDEESLAYDFSVEQGDTVTIWNTLTLNTLSPFQVVVDTTYYEFFAGMNRKTIELGGGVEIWREGIGCMEGIDRYGWKTSGLAGWSYRLLCYFKNDSLYYHLNTYPECYYPVPTQIQIQTVSSKEINIYPNPATNNLTVEITNDKLSQRDAFGTNLNIEIVDLTGKQIMSSFRAGGEGISSNRHITTINIKSLPAGIYFVKVETNQGTVVKKFVKQ